VIVAVTVSFVVASSVQAAMGHRDLAILLALAAPLGISAWGFARGGHDEAAVVLLCGVLVTVASLIVDCAISRRESRGLHYTLDYPESDSRFVRETTMRRT
jgi:hypothetical protein